jgi:hypothetical protein
MFGTDIEAPFRPPAHAGVSSPTRTASVRIDIERRKWSAASLRRRTEAVDAPGRQGATTENIGNI